MKIIDNIKVILIGLAVLDLEVEKTNIPRSMFPSLNPYYYKIKKLNAFCEVKE